MGSLKGVILNHFIWPLWVWTIWNR